jgi:hypothetical protein
VPVDDARIDLWAVQEWGRRLVAEGGPDAEWVAYRVFRGRVLEEAEGLVLADAVAQS